MFACGQFDASARATDACETTKVKQCLKLHIAAGVCLLHVVAQADPKYEARRKQIRKRWSRLTQQTGSLGAQEKRFALGSEIWEPKTVAKVSCPI